MKFKLNLSSSLIKVRDILYFGKRKYHHNDVGTLSASEDFPPPTPKNKSQCQIKYEILDKRSWVVVFGEAESTAPRNQPYLVSPFWVLCAPNEVS